jgi:hypothetical protein
LSEADSNLELVRRVLPRRLLDVEHQTAGLFIPGMELQADPIKELDGHLVAGQRLGLASGEGAPREIGEG